MPLERAVKQRSLVLLVCALGFLALAASSVTLAIFWRVQTNQLWVPVVASLVLIVALVACLRGRTLRIGVIAWCATAAAAAFLFTYSAVLAVLNDGVSGAAVGAFFWHLLYLTALTGDGAIAFAAGFAVASLIRVALIKTRAGQPQSSLEARYRAAPTPPRFEF